jgi:hypothetical protein
LAYSKDRRVGVDSERPVKPLEGKPIPKVSPPELTTIGACGVVGSDTAKSVASVKDLSVDQDPSRIVGSSGSPAQAERLPGLADSHIAMKAAINFLPKKLIYAPMVCLLKPYLDGA